VLNVYSRLVIGLITTLICAILVYNLLHAELYVAEIGTAIERFGVPAVVIAGLVGALYSRLQTRLMIANTIVAVVAALYCGEFYLAWRLDNQQQQAGRATGVQFDGRSKIAVLHDLRASGVDAYPIIRGRNLLQADRQGQLHPMLSIAGNPILPLTGLPRVTEVSCNETGQWQIYQSDRYGFNNDDALWDARPPAVAMIGDSFAHGSCVRRDQNMEAHLRERFGPTLNLGVGGDGPLLELAALTEYAEPVRPKIVLWAFFEGNDLNEDLPLELRSPLLRRYLAEPSFTQDLIHKTGDITSALKAYLDQNLHAAMDRVDDPTEGLLRYVSLDRVRNAAGLGPVQIGYNGGRLSDELDVFGQVMRAAQAKVQGWGGQLYLVYLPESDRYLAKFGGSSVREKIYRGVRAVAEKQAIEFIDVAAAFSQQPSPGKLFVYPGSHYNPEGYAVAARAIAERLNHDVK